MSTQVAYRRDSLDGSRESADLRSDSRLPAAALEPMLEGARARGLADGYELIGQAAVLLDGSGGVLHVGASAMRLLGDGLDLRGGHLVGTGSANQQLEDLIGAALRGEEPESGRRIRVEGKAGTRLDLRVLPFRDGQGRPGQLLKAVVLLDPVA